MKFDYITDLMMNELISSLSTTYGIDAAAYYHYHGRFEVSSAVAVVTDNPNYGVILGIIIHKLVKDPTSRWYNLSDKFDVLLDPPFTRTDQLGFKYIYY